MRTERANNKTVVRLIYVLSDYRERALDNAILNKIESQLATIREVGDKAILRFAYNWGEQAGQGWYLDQDASKDRIIAHLTQLQPVLARNKDVIAVLDAGFIGVWGEWHHTTNNLLVDGGPNPDTGVNDNTRAIINKLLEVIPSNRAVGLRYARYKMALYGSTPLDWATAYNSTARSRVGAYHDCLLASANDWWSYGNVDQEKNFYNQDNRFVPMSGETCNANADAAPFINCENSLNELARLRFDLLNSGYEPNVIQGWRNGGCYSEMDRRLGYRFRLIKSVLPTKVNPGGTFQMQYEIKNDGWGKMFNQRRPEIILRRTTTGERYRLVWSWEDLRFGFGGETRTVNIAAGIPANMPAGEYAVLLNLPDLDARLRDKPEYSIRLANSGLWEAATGYNALQRNVVIDAQAQTAAYSGEAWFSRIP